jgi:hypothetical protein
LLIAVDGVADQVPVLVAVVVAIGVVLLPSYSFTVDEPSARPVNVGVLSFVAVPLAGLEITGAGGGVVSTNVTVTRNDAVPVLPAESVAEQVTVVVPTGNVEPEAGVQTGVIEPSTKSVAVAVNVTTVPEELGAATVMSAGTLTEGLVVSLTVTVNEPEAVLPRVSDVEQLTVVVPSGNVEPEAGVQLTDRVPSTRSVAVAVNVTILPDALVASAMMFDGSVRVGAVVSLTVIVNDAVPVFPAASVAEQLTVVVVIGKVEPDAGLHVAVIEPSTLSVAVTVKLTEAPDGPVASTVIGEGTVSTGGVVSELLPLLDTVTEMLRVPTLLYGSYPLASRVCEPFGTEAVFHEMW